jgi:hypothetical protein
LKVESFKPDSRQTIFCKRIPDPIKDIKKMRDLRGNEKFQNKNGQLLFENIVSTFFRYL